MRLIRNEGENQPCENEYADDRGGNAEIYQPRRRNKYGSMRWVERVVYLGKSIIPATRHRQKGQHIVTKKRSKRHYKSEYVKDGDL